MGPVLRLQGSFVSEQQREDGDIEVGRMNNNGYPLRELDLI